MRPIYKLLVANRGEIARRVLRTCRELGIRTVAVYSDADAGAAHALEADEAVYIGPSPSRESYLMGERVLDAARRTGADAIHPGYGFLSENAAFAEAVEAAGLVWVGPTPSAMRALGEKAPARRLAAELGVPVVPGYDGEDDSHERLVAEAARIGLPLLIKASAGGGGRGMRRVDSWEELEEALRSARREAETAFGDGRLLIERYVERPRHIEVQVLGDGRGHVVHLFERECSIQRRHQKIVEEAPSPAVDEALRERLGEAATRLARAVGYRGAGTVEFILDPHGAFYFLEMNARLQVEHPVTELVTGVDLVAWQIAIAEGRPLTLLQDELQLRGHAIEVRVCAEDPSRGWVGGTGRLLRFVLPDGVRADAGYVQGDEVGVHYDSLLAKLIATGPDRLTAARRLRRALGEAWIAGVVNNLPLLRDIAADEAFLAGDLDTGFLARRGLPRPPPVDLPRSAAVAAVIGRALSATPLGAGFRIDGVHEDVDRWAMGDLAVETRLGREVAVDGAARELRLVALGDGSARIVEAGVARTVRWARDGAGPLQDGETVYLHLGDAEGMVRLVPRFPAPKGLEPEPGTCAAPTPGIVRAVLVEEGQEVAAGAPLVVLEAMKMEHTLRSPADGVVLSVRVQVGEAVDAGAVLVRVG